MLDIAIVIPAYNDPLLDACLKSIDEQVEIVVVLNGATDEVKAIARSHSVSIVELSEPNLANAYNQGILQSKSSNVLLMDSDCVFHSGTIRKLYKLLESKPLAKGRVLFSYKSRVGKIIATARHIHTARKNAYSPPLAFRKSIVHQIGGHFFDPILCWTEDYDFDARVQGANLEIAYDDTARVVHPQLTFKQDLRSAFNYGTGHARGVILKKAGYNRPKNAFINVRKMFSVIQKKYGLPTAIYLVLWNVSFLLGYRTKIGENV